jgi:hypothetical protein
MIIRMITYHALPGKDVEGWMKSTVNELRGVAGMRQMEFVQSQSDPTLYGAMMHFRNKEDLDNYKETGPYRSLVQSLREAWLDESKPVNDQVFEVFDI